MKDTIFAYTPEVGTAFWQPQAEIESTCANMVYSNMVLSHMPHKYLVVNETDPSTIATTPRFLTQNLSPAHPAA